MFSNWQTDYLTFVAPRVTESTQRTIRHRCNEWHARVTNTEIPTRETVEHFRNTCLQSGLSPRTIESVITVVRQICIHNGHQLDIGRRLPAKRPNPTVPSIDLIDALYRNASVALWPCRLTAAKREEWWRAYLVLSSWTAMRISDLEAMKWDQVEATAIRITAKKTARFGRVELAVPITEFVRRHLDAVRGWFGESVFGLTSCRTQLRRELARIAKAARTKYTPPHGLRRFSINQWTAADTVAGQIIQGQALGSFGHYLDVHRHLARVAPNVEMPPSFFTAEELQRRRDNEAALIAAYRSAREPDRGIILEVVRRFA